MRKHDETPPSDPTPDDRAPSPPSPSGDREEARAPEEAPQFEPELPEDRVVNAGTSQELTIVDYADDIRAHARRKMEENAAKRLEDSRNRLAEANQSLILVRDAAMQHELERRRQEAKAPPPEPPPARPGAWTPPVVETDGPPPPPPPPRPPSSDRTARPAAEGWKPPVLDAAAPPPPPIPPRPADASSGDPAELAIPRELWPDADDEPEIEEWVPRSVPASPAAASPRPPAPAPEPTPAPAPAEEPELTLERIEETVEPEPEPEEPSLSAFARESSERILELDDGPGDAETPGSEREILLDDDEPSALAAPEPLAVETPTPFADTEPLALDEPVGFADPEPLALDEPAALAGPEPLALDEPAALAEPKPLAPDGPTEPASHDSDTLEFVESHGASPQAHRPDSVDERRARLEELLDVDWDAELDPTHAARPAPSRPTRPSASAREAAAPERETTDSAEESADPEPSPPIVLEGKAAEPAWDAIDPGADSEVGARSDDLAGDGAEAGGDEPPAAEDPQPLDDAGPGTTPPSSRILMLAGAVVWAGATPLMAMGIEPVSTWYYLFAWYPLLLIVNHLAAARSPSHSLLAGRIGPLAALAGWSIPVWLFFEACNFRLENWYYVGLPDSSTLRHVGILASFATVLPGLFFLEELLAVRGVLTRTRTSEFSVGPVLERTMLIVGAAWFALIALFPTKFFPLVWGVPVLLLEAWLHRRDESSLLAELSRGRPGRMLRLLLAGMAAGLFWEAANAFAAGKWIYTVPGFPDGKLFEMPVLGFLGFPPFALCCWSMARALVKLNLLPEWQVGRSEESASTPILSGNARAGAIAGAVILSGVVLAGMDRWTVDSVTPRPETVPGIPDGIAEYAAQRGVRDLDGIIKMIDAGQLRVPGASSAEAMQALRDRCELALLGGIGTENVGRLTRAGISSVEELALLSPEEVTQRLDASQPGWSPHPRRVDVWVRAARAETGLLPR